MLREILYRNTMIPLLRNGLDAFAERQRAIASNIAHLEVPGYRRRSVIFESLLKRALGDRGRALDATQPRHLPEKSDPSEVKPVLCEERSDGKMSGINNMDIDREIADLATNQVQYHLAARRAQEYFGEIRRLTKEPT